MRPDMHKVVVERPRWNPGPSKKGRRANLPDELLPKFEGIKRPHRHRKGLTDLLGPLKRWLQAQVGRAWNDVYSEACAVIKPDSIIRAHVKTHLLQFVERHTFMHEERVCVLEMGYRGRGIVPVEERRYGWNLFFVHPETGLLQVIPQMSKRVLRASEQKLPVAARWIGKNLAVQQIRGLWFACRFERPDGIKVPVYDHALERTLRREEITQHRHAYLWCVHKRQLSHRELRRYDLRNAIGLKAQSSIGSIRCRLTTALQVSAGRRSWVIGHCRLAVQIRLRVSTRVAQFVERQCYPDRSLPAAFNNCAQAILMGRRCRVICHRFDSVLPRQMGQ
ncbi:MAG: hypothetical protein QM813_17525 [Verrucomicrobiota bacterium]